MDSDGFLTFFDSVTLGRLLEFKEFSEPLRDFLFSHILRWIVDFVFDPGK